MQARVHPASSLMRGVAFSCRLLRATVLLTAAVCVVVQSSASAFSKGGDHGPSHAVHIPKAQLADGGVREQHARESRQLMAEPPPGVAPEATPFSPTAPGLVYWHSASSLSAGGAPAQFMQDLSSSGNSGTVASATGLTVAFDAPGTAGIAPGCSSGMTYINGTQQSSLMFSALAVPKIYSWCVVARCGAAPLRFRVTACLLALGCWRAG